MNGAVQHAPRQNVGPQETPWHPKNTPCWLVQETSEIVTHDPLGRQHGPSDCGHGLVGEQVVAGM
jgi:hypothetical protein